jgi:hypothetical protein
MTTTDKHTLNITVHSWLKKIRVSYYPGITTPLINKVGQGLLESFKKQGHQVLADPRQGPDVLITTAVFGKPVNWRESLLLRARRLFKLEKAPMLFTIVHAQPSEFDATLNALKNALEKEVPNPEDYIYPGLAPMAFHTLHEQGRRGGTMLSLIRLVQSQSMSIRILLVIGDDQPLEAYTFDMVGSYPRTPGVDEGFFYDDLVLRIVTAASTTEVTDHIVVGEPIPRQVWDRLSTPGDMLTAGIELGKRHFFTEMVRVANLSSAPGLHEAVSSQYSEGCFATWDPIINGLVTTVTGSARPVEKYNLTEDDLAVIVGLREDGQGALVRQVEGKLNDPPSSEAVELVMMDKPLPEVVLAADFGFDEKLFAPVARSKLHGHRGIRSYHPHYVEHVALEEPYSTYLVSCSTEAQARAITSAFSHSESLQNPDDRKKLVFTIIPGHGLVVVEKWDPEKKPFQTIWEYMDSGLLEVDNHIPQGKYSFVPDRDGRMYCREERI